MRVPIEWLKEFVAVNIGPKDLAQGLTMSGLEVESIDDVGGEQVLEIGITPNRSDCLSILGIARDCHAMFDAKFTPLKISVLRGERKMSDFVNVSVKAKSSCPRYTARVIDGVKIAPSPEWLAKRIEACGLRSINNVVDAANLVMMELGQPLHAFDLDFIGGKKIVVQKMNGMGEFATIDGGKQKLVKDDLLICDASGPVALAGVMGGLNSEVRDSTTKLLLESAFFEPTGVRKTSKRLGLHSESSRRFERGVDPNGVLNALHRLTEIIVEVAGGKPTSDWVDIYPVKIKPISLSISEMEVERILGLKISTAQIRKILGSLGFDVAVPRGDKVSAKVPTFRNDIERPIDLIEEVARIYGYEKIPEAMPTFRFNSIVRPPFADVERKIRRILIDAGLTEAVLYGFTSVESLKPFAEISQNPVDLANPLSVEHAVMCTTLLPGLLDACKFNASRQRTDCRLFALQNVFGPKREAKLVSGVLMGKRFPSGWERAKELVDFYDVKGVVESVFKTLKIEDDVSFSLDGNFSFMHPGSFANVLVKNEKVGFVGGLHPNVAAIWDLKQGVFIFEIDFEKIAKLSKDRVVKYCAYSKFPFVERDIAFLVSNNIQVEDIKKALVNVENAVKVHVFDVYKGKGVPEGKKSLAISIRFSKNDRTLEDDEVNRAHEKIVGILQKDFGAELRT